MDQKQTPCVVVDYGLVATAPAATLVVDLSAVSDCAQLHATLIEKLGVLDPAGEVYQRPDQLLPQNGALPDGPLDIIVERPMPAEAKAPMQAAAMTDEPQFVRQGRPTFTIIGSAANATNLSANSFEELKAAVLTKLLLGPTTIISIKFNNYQLNGAAWDEVVVPAWAAAEGPLALTCRHAAPAVDVAQLIGNVRQALVAMQPGQLFTPALQAALAAHSSARPGMAFLYEYAALPGPAVPHRCFIQRPNKSHSAPTEVVIDEVQRWDITAEEVSCKLWDLWGPDPVPVPQGVNNNVVLGMELGVRDAVLEHLARRANLVFRLTAPAGAAYCSGTAADSVHDLNGHADQVPVIPVVVMTQATLSKTPCRNPTIDFEPVDLLEACGATSDLTLFEDLVDRLLPQLTGQMQSMVPPASYGVVTTFHGTTLVRRSPNGGLLISRPFALERSLPSVPQLLVWLMRQATKRQQPPFPPADGTTISARQSKRTWAAVLKQPAQLSGGSGGGGGSGSGVGGSKRNEGPSGNTRQQKKSRAQQLSPPPPLVQNVGAALGRGITGAVRCCSFQGAPAALKSASLTDAAPMVELLQNEIAVYEGLLQLQGTFVPRVLVSGREGSRLFLVLQRIDGVRADELQHPASESLVHSATQALAAVHRAGYLHGDLNAGNVLVTKTQVFLIDFGQSSRVVDDELPEYETHREHERLLDLFR